ncbi:TPA: hypothetical protein ACH3X1_014459 [Trebouxia sp. C0004]
MFWWHCQECPKGKVHSWQAPAYVRTSSKNASECHVCAGQRVCECNSLETASPDIAADFDVQKNGVSVAKVTSSTHTKYSWLSDEPGAKKQSVRQCTLYTRKQLKTVSRCTSLVYTCIAVSKALCQKDVNVCDALLLVLSWLMCS